MSKRTRASERASERPGSRLCAEGLNEGGDPSETAQTSGRTGGGFSHALHGDTPSSCLRNARESIMCARVVVWVATTRFVSLSTTIIVTEPPAPMMPCPHGSQHPCRRAYAQALRPGARGALLSGVFGCPGVPQALDDFETCKIGSFNNWFSRPPVSAAPRPSPPPPSPPAHGTNSTASASAVHSSCAMSAVRNSPVPRAFGGRPRSAAAVAPRSGSTHPRTPAARRRMEPLGARLAT